MEKMEDGSLDAALNDVAPKTPPETSEPEAPPLKEDKSEPIVFNFVDPGLRKAESSPPLETVRFPEKPAEEASAKVSPEKAGESKPGQQVPAARTDKNVKPAIVIKDLTKTFVIGKEKVRALRGVNLEIYPGEIVCLLGTSGSGKSTLLNMMAGLEKPTKGSITICGQRVDNMSERKLAKFRQKYMGFVFQSYNLLPNLTAIDNVSMPLMFSGVKRRIRDREAKKILKLCGLGKRMRHKPTQMSGGQQQRVGIARAFVAKPKIVFADEPTGNLDTRTTIEIMEMMVSMSRENRQTLIIVTHDTEIAAYADKIFHIIDGVISSVEDNTANQITVGSEEAARIIAAAESV